MSTQIKRNVIHVAGMYEVWYFRNNTSNPYTVYRGVYKMAVCSNEKDAMVIPEALSVYENIHS